MLDADIVSALITEIRTQLEQYGIASADLNVMRSSQPTAQYPGAVPGTAPYQVYIQPVTNEQVGWSRKYSGAPGSYTRTVKHTKIRDYQISTLTDFDPATMAVLPAHDLAEILSDMLQQPSATQSLRESGVYVISTTAVRPVFEVNKQDLWQSMPSFDIRVSYNSEYSRTVDTVSDAELDVHNV